MACSCYMISTKVECTLLAVGRNLFREQTWGRAVRAPNNSRELGALLICGGFFLPVISASFGVSESSLRSAISALCTSGALAPTFCTKACTLHRSCLRYDVPPPHLRNPETGRCREARQQGG